MGTQAHPELKSRPTRAHPLFAAFVGAAMDYKAAERLPVEIPEHAHEPHAADHDDAQNGAQGHGGSAQPLTDPLQETLPEHVTRG